MGPSWVLITTHYISPPGERRMIDCLTPEDRPPDRVPQETGESTYDKPSAVDGVGGGGGAAYEAAGEWAKYFDAEYAVDYYHNFRRVLKHAPERALKLTLCSIYVLLLFLF